MLNMTGACCTWLHPVRHRYSSSLWECCVSRPSESNAVLQVADSANSMGAGGLRAEAGSGGQCRKIMGDARSMAGQSLLVEP